MNKKEERKAILKALNYLGFKREYRDRDLVQYKFGRSEWSLFMTVQLWNYGMNRISHGHFGRENTYPIEFRFVEELIAAVEKEARCKGEHLKIGE